MVDLRRTLLLVAAVALFSSLVCAQVVPVTGVTCSIQASIPTIIRDVANADTAGDVTLDCTGGVPTPFNTPIPQVNIQVFYTAPVTSKVLAVKGGLQKLESILMFDELAVPNNTVYTPRTRKPCVNGATATYNTLLDRCDVLSSGNPVESYLGDPVANTGDKPNIFQAVAVPNASSDPSGRVYSIGFYGVPFDPPGTLTHRYIRITNVRLQSGGFGAQGGYLPTIAATVLVQSPFSVSIVQNSTNVAYVQRTMSATVDTFGKTFLQCESETGTCPSFKVKFTELQQAAFKRRNSGINPGAYTYVVNDLLTAQDRPGAMLNTEDMFTSSALTDTLSKAGIAKYGSRLIARIENVPAGVTLYATTVSENFSGAGATVDVAKAIMVQGTTVTVNGDGGGMDKTGTKTVAADCDNKYWPTTQTDRNLVAMPTVTAASGTTTAFAVYEIVDEAPNLVQTVSVGIVVNYTAKVSEEKPEIRDDTAVKAYLGPINITAVPAAFSTISGSSVPVAPAPRHNEVNAMDPAAGKLFSIIKCRTNILWPYVAQMGSSFDTGIAIANTSQDPFDYADPLKYGTHPREQKGACRIYYYGKTGASDPAPAVAVTPVINGGSTFAWSLYGGRQDTTPKIPAAREFIGYIIAVCDFQYGHGYGYITDLGGQNAQGYVALVMDADLNNKTLLNNTRSKSRSEVLEQ